MLHLGACLLAVAPLGATPAASLEEPGDPGRVVLGATAARAERASNPIITHKFTADPAALVHDDTVYLYAGHDQAAEGATFYDLREWLVFSSTNLVDWQEHPVPLRATDFAWATGMAWASHVVERDGTFFWYATVRHDETRPGFAIGVASAASPTGPFADARGSALIHNQMTTQTPIDWDDIDPAVFIDDDGRAYIYWGNTVLKWARLADNMVALQGGINTIDLPFFTEAPWVHERGGRYYLSYAHQYPEKIAYAMSDSPEGPWESKGLLNELAGNCNTNHQAIIEFRGQDYFFYHTGGIQPSGGPHRRSVCIDYLHTNADGTLQRVQMTTEGVLAVEPRPAPKEHSQP